MLRRAVIEFAARNGASERRCEDIALAVSEALANAVIHAYVGYDEPGGVGVEAWMNERSLEVVVCDEGIGLKPRVDSPGLGLGLALIGQMTERLVLDSAETQPGVCVRMTFAID